MYLFCVRKLNMTKFKYLWVSVHTYILAYFLCTLMLEEQKKNSDIGRKRTNNNIHIL